MKTKRKGPRYASGTGWITRDGENWADVPKWDRETVVRALNAGERAKAEVKRLKVRVAELEAELRMPRMDE